VVDAEFALQVLVDTLRAPSLHYDPDELPLIELVPGQILPIWPGASQAAGSRRLR
jgi:hypothetical protein